MIVITINGKKQEREFQNMAQALAFAYQNGECYGAKCVELSDGVSGKTSKDVGGFTQADVDKAVNESNKQISLRLNEAMTELKAKEAEIAELKKQLDITRVIGNPEPVPNPETETKKEADVENTSQAKK